MDGKGWAIDNIRTERLWPSVKYKEVYLNEYANPREARRGLTRYWHFYNYARLHQSLCYAGRDVLRPFITITINGGKESLTLLYFLS